MYSHSELVKKAKSWLLNAAGCGFALCELGTAHSPETPDAIGFREGDISILVECKTSRSDFLADRKKLFRYMPEQGMGAFRFYLAPKGTIKPDELPTKWGLIEVKGSGKPVKTVGKKGNVWTTQQAVEWMFGKNERNIRAEFAILSSALRRVHLRGDLDKIYELPK